jgi:hypothetical protein
MASYLPEVLCLVLSAYARRDDSSEVSESRVNLLHAVTEKLPTEVCAENLSASWETIPHKQKVSRHFVFLADFRPLPCLSSRWHQLLRLVLVKI